MRISKLLDRLTATVRTRVCGEKVKNGDISMSKVSRRRRWWWQSESEKMEGGNKLSTLLGPILEPFPVYHIFHMILSLLLPSFPVTKQPCDAMRCNCFLFFFYFRIYCGLYVTHLADLLLFFYSFFSFSPSIPPPHTHTSMRKAIKRATIS